MTRANVTTRTIHSERAAWAWAKVMAVSTSGLGPKYATHARKLPARVLTSGLGQAMAFLFAKSQGGTKGDGTAKLLEHLGERILTTLGHSVPPSFDAKKVMQIILDMDPQQYRQCTHELLAASEWLKRFAEGFFGKNEDSDDT